MLTRLQIQQVTVDATDARSILAALARNASDEGFPALAQSIVVALAEGRSRAVSDAVASALAIDGGRNASQVSAINIKSTCTCDMHDLLRQGLNAPVLLPRTCCDLCSDAEGNKRACCPIVVALHIKHQAPAPYRW